MEMSNRKFSRIFLEEEEEEREREREKRFRNSSARVLESSRAVLRRREHLDGK